MIQLSSNLSLLSRMDRNPRYVMENCPYDPNHKVRADRLQYHLIKCRKENSTKEKTTCPFNASHIIPKEQRLVHLQTCPDREYLEPQMKETTRAGSSFAPKPSASTNEPLRRPKNVVIPGGMRSNDSGRKPLRRPKYVEIPGEKPRSS